MTQGASDHLFKKSTQEPNAKMINKAAAAETTYTINDY